MLTMMCAALCCAVAVQASVYDLYDLLSLAADQLPPPPPKSSARGGRGGRGGRGRGRGSSSRDGPAVETEALATCARIVGELTPGSSSHVELATEYMVRYAHLATLDVFATVGWVAVSDFMWVGGMKLLPAVCMASLPGTHRHQQRIRFVPVD